MGQPDADLYKQFTMMCAKLQARHPDLVFDEEGQAHHRDNNLSFDLSDLVRTGIVSMTLVSRIGVLKTDEFSVRSHPYFRFGQELEHGSYRPEYDVADDGSEVCTVRKDLHGIENYAACFVDDLMDLYTKVYEA